MKEALFNREVLLTSAVAAMVFMVIDRVFSGTFQWGLAILFFGLFAMAFAGVRKLLSRRS